MLGRAMRTAAHLAPRRGERSACCRACMQTFKPEYITIKAALCAPASGLLDRAGHIHCMQSCPATLPRGALRCQEHERVWTSSRWTDVLRSV